MATILIVDDEYLATLLESGEHRLLAARDGAEALALIRQERPDLVFADVLVPEMQGYEFVRQLRTDPAINHTRVIFYTAPYLESEARSLAQAYGIRRVLLKPGERDEILSVVGLELGDPTLLAPGPLAPEFDQQYQQLLIDKLAFRTRQLEQEAKERRHAEQELKTTARQLKNIFEGLDDVFFSYDVVNARLLQISPACNKLFGWPQQAFYENPLLWQQVLHPLDLPAIADLELKNARGQQTVEEHRMLRPDGSLRWVQTRIKPALDAGGRLLRLDGFVSDIDEHKHLEEQFRQSQKMEAIGQMTGGIAHDFNNLLTVILAFSDMLLQQQNSAAKEYKQLNAIRKAGEKAAALIDQLLTFSRKQLLQARVLNLNEVVTDVELMLRRVIGEDIDLVTALEPALGRVEVDPSQIDQIVMNLAVNARDAMPKGGDLTIETANVELDEVYTRLHLGVQPGSYVMLAVSDTGCGMDAALQSRIFEPFFTTKEPGKGTGLGLSTVFGITRQSGGHVWVYSEPGKGTVFKIYLPRVEHQPTAMVTEALPSGALGSGETLLVVEDEPAVRELVCDLLQEAGYNVLRAKNGDEALLVAEQYKEKIQLLVTDVVMPKLGGRDLAERLYSDFPQLRVLYMSGYTDDTIIRHGVLSSDLAFLQKPFTQSSLLSKVRQVLDARHSR